MKYIFFFATAADVLSMPVTLEKREGAKMEDDGPGSEEFIAGEDGGGGIYVDFTATREDGSAVRILYSSILSRMV